jgi:hypothetical protein
MSLLAGQLIKDRFFYLPQMGMYWDLIALKRFGDEMQFSQEIDRLNDNLQKNPKAAGQQWKVGIFLNGAQITNLDQKWQNSYCAKSYLMYAKPDFDGKGEELPAVGVWNPVHFVWVSNYKVYVWQFKDTPEHTAEWLGNKFAVVNPVDVDAYPAPKGSLVKPGNPPVTPPVTPPVDDTTGDTTNPPAVSGHVTFHFYCPHCGKKII